MRWGTLQLPHPDDAVDARTGTHGFLAEGPFEEEIEVVGGDVFISVFAAEVTGQTAPHRLVACIDVRPSQAHAFPKPNVVVLDVQPMGDAPATPFVLDAVTGEKLQIDTSQLVDENNAPCDRRQQTRMAWDENLRRLHRSRSR